jgi:hypothetical protein
MNPIDHPHVVVRVRVVGGRPSDISLGYPYKREIGKLVLKKNL